MDRRRLLLLSLLPLVYLAMACGRDETRDSASSPTGNAPGVASAVRPTGTPERRVDATPTVPAASPPATTTALLQTSPPPLASAPPRASAPTATASSAGGSTVTVAFPFENAAQARFSLMGNARFGAAMDQFDSLDPMDARAYPGWNAAYPQLRLVGAAVNATPSTVSVYRGPLNAKEPASAANPKVIAFAVADNKGGCAGGIIRGFPSYNDYQDIEIGASTCNAQSVLNQLRR